MEKIPQQSKFFITLFIKIRPRFFKSLLKFIKSKVSDIEEIGAYLNIFQSLFLSLASFLILQQQPEGYGYLALLIIIIIYIVAALQVKSPLLLINEIVILTIFLSNGIMISILFWKQKQELIKLVILFFYSSVNFLPLKKKSNYLILYFINRSLMLLVPIILTFILHEELIRIYCIICFQFSKIFLIFKLSQREKEETKFTTERQEISIQITKNNFSEEKSDRPIFDNRWNNKIGRFPFPIVILDKNDKTIIYTNDHFIMLFNLLGKSLEQIHQFLFTKLQFTIINSSNDNDNLKPLQQLQGCLRSKLRNYSINSGQTEKINSLQKVYLQRFSNSCDLNQDDFLSKQSNLENIFDNYLNGLLKIYFETSQQTLDLNCYFKHSQKSNFFTPSERQIMCKIFSNEEEEIFILFIDVSKLNQQNKDSIQTEYKSKIVQSFSHELRTPLNSATNFITASLMDQTVASTSKESYLIPALSCLKLQQYLIQDIIDFSQFQSQAIKFEQRTFSILEIINELNEIFHSQFKLKQMGFYIYLSKCQQEQIGSDFSRLLQILINLISNSVKFSTDGDVTLFIIKKKFGQIKFTIEDKGIGMTEEKIQQLQYSLNQMKEQGDIVKQKNWQGFGLIAAQMLLNVLGPPNKNVIKINSKGIGNGSKFSFTIKNFSFQQINSLENCNELNQSVRSLKNVLNFPSEAYLLKTLIIIYKPKIYSQLDNEQFEYPLSNLIKNKKNNNASKKEKINDKIQNLNKQIYYFMDKSSKHEKPTNINFKQTSQIIHYEQIQQLDNEDKEQQFKQATEKYFQKCVCKKILAVDDEIFNLHSLKLIIGMCGIEVKLVEFNNLQIARLKMVKKRLVSLKKNKFVEYIAENLFLFQWIAKCLLWMAGKRQVEFKNQSVPKKSPIYLSQDQLLLPQNKIFKNVFKLE